MAVLGQSHVTGKVCSKFLNPLISKNYLEITPGSKFLREVIHYVLRSGSPNFGDFHSERPWKLRLNTASATSGYAGSLTSATSITT
jgi:hypothetical protein